MILQHTHSTFSIKIYYVLGNCSLPEDISEKMLHLSLKTSMARA